MLQISFTAVYTNIAKVVIIIFTAVYTKYCHGVPNQFYCGVYEHSHCAPNHFNAVYTNIAKVLLIVFTAVYTKHRQGARNQFYRGVYEHSQGAPNNCTGVFSNHRPRLQENIIYNQVLSLYLVRIKHSLGDFLITSIIFKPGNNYGLIVQLKR